MASASHTLFEKHRVSSIDIVRGIVMVIMALDHTRDYFHTEAVVFDPTDMTKTNPGLFFTRWITHFCAPAFALLAGTSIYLQRVKKSKRELSLFLLTRGLWLIVVELVVMRFAYSFNFYYDVTFMGILWMIGVCMILLSFLIYLPELFALLLSLILVFGHNLADGFEARAPFNVPWSILMRIGVFPITEGHTMVAPYAIVPWLGIMLFGFAMGWVFTGEYDAKMRRRLLFNLGMLAIILFIFLRFVNSYGDPNPWATQESSFRTLMSFLNVTKYPISLLFTLMTVGSVMITLAGVERVRPAILRAIEVFGRVPLFYFILHFYLIHASALIFFMIKTGKSLSEIDFHAAKSFGGITPEGGYSLPWVYLAWVAVVLVMYPLCRWYDRYKRTHKNWWLSYL